MTVITASPKGFSKLLDLQETANKELVTIRSLLEIQKNGANVVAKVQKEHLAVAKQTHAVAKKQLEEYKKELAKIMESMKVFKSPAEKVKAGIGGMLEKMKPENLKTWFLEKTNIMGVNDRRIQRGKWIKEQRALGAEGTDEQLSEKYQKAYSAKKDYAKTQEEIEKVKKATGGKYTEKELAQSSEKNKALFAQREAAMKEYSQYDIGAQLKASKVKAAPLAAAEQTADALNKTPTSQYAASISSEENQLENARLMDEQTTLLKKIEENTRGASPEQKAEPKGEEGKGLLSGLLGGGKAGNMLKGLKDFGAGLVLIAGSLWVASKALQGFAEVEWSSVAKGMAVLAGMAAAAIVLNKASKSLKEVGIGLMTLGAAMWVAAKGLGAFADINWSDIGKGMTALGGLVLVSVALNKVKGSMIGGAIGLGALALATWGISEAFKSFADLDWETIGKGFVAVAGLGALGVILGNFVGPAMLGALAIGALGAAVWIAGKGFQEMNEAFSGFTDNLERLAQIDGMNLLKVAAGVAALGPAMALFAAGNVAAGLSNLVTGFLSAVTGQKSPVDQLIEIGKAGEGINQAGSGMQRLAEGMSKFNEIKGDSLKQLKEFPWEQATKFVAAGGAVTQAGTTVYNASKQNADVAADAKGGTPGVKQNIVNAPVTNNTTQNNIIRTHIRNQESTQSQYIKNRFAF